MDSDTFNFRSLFAGLLLSQFVSAPLYAEAPLDINGTWILVDHKCVSTQGTELPIKRPLLEKGLILTLEEGRFAERFDFSMCTLRNQGSYQNSDTPHHYTFLKVSETACIENGITWSSTKGSDHTSFQYERDGFRLLETQQECADGQGAYIWIYHLFNPLNS